MKTNSFLSILALSTLLLSACSFSSGIRTDNDKTVLPETDENKIKVFSGSQIPHQHLIGEVFAYQDLCECPERVIELLKEEAAAMGANAIMGLELQYDYDNASLETKGRAQAIFMSEAHLKEFE